MHSQFELLKSRRFLPFFVTQFFGAFNDNVFKNALLILFAYSAATHPDISESTLINLSAGLFILPFFLFSATAGQIADKYEKAQQIRYIKLAEIVIMVMGAIALLNKSLTLQLVTLFLMGAQSAFFGPVKYGILPQHLKNDELVGGNGLVEAGTFLSILLGTIAGGILIAQESNGAMLVSSAVLLVATLGFLSSCYIPKAKAVAANIKIDWNIWRATGEIVSASRKNRTVFLSILGISWFWLYGSVILAQLPLFSRDILEGNEHVVTLLLAIFSIGIGLGSLWCERLAAYRIELGLVPFGAFGLTIFALDLYWASSTYTSTQSAIGALDFLSNFKGWRIVGDLFFMALFGGFYIVPLYALVQNRSPQDQISRNIAANNIINSAFMVLAAILAAGLLKVGLNIPQIFLCLGLLNAIVAIYIFNQIPEFLMRLMVWLLVNTIYRLKEQELHNIPEHGPAVLVSNHVSFIDALIITAASRRPIRFVMDHNIFKLPILSFAFRTSGAIPIASAQKNPELLNQAFDTIAQALENGELVCIFPEGQITYDGELGKFKSGIEKIIQRTPVTVVPLAIKGLFGSFFSRRGGKAMQLKNLPGRLFAKITLLSGKPLSPEEVTAERLQVEVQQMLA